MCQRESWRESVQSPFSLETAWRESVQLGESPFSLERESVQLGESPFNLQSVRSFAVSKELDVEHDDFPSDLCSNLQG